jgi:hypothetical protein
MNGVPLMGRPVKTDSTGALTVLPAVNEIKKK